MVISRIDCITADISCGMSRFGNELSRIASLSERFEQTDEALGEYYWEKVRIASNLSYANARRFLGEALAGLGEEIVGLVIPQADERVFQEFSRKMAAEGIDHHISPQLASDGRRVNSFCVFTREKDQRRVLELARERIRRAKERLSQQQLRQRTMNRAREMSR